MPIPLLKTVLKTMSVCLDAALSILIPMGVVLYAVSGGLKATFTTSYIHTVIIFVVLCVFMFKTYCGGGELGSISKVTHFISFSFCNSKKPFHSSKVTTCPKSCLQTLPC